MRKICSIMLLVLCISLSACGSAPELSEDSATTSIPSDSTSVDTDSKITDTQHPESESAEQNLNPLFFESDEVINHFFVEYNNIAEIQIPAEDVKKVISVPRH